ncbi:MAG: hypothetical protein ACTSYB_16430 [Candidatus Helarchaeota archaeon]
MPKGIVLIGWTNKEGFFLIHNYPSDVTLTDEEVMRIGSTHRMRNLDANTITLRLKNLNVVSFFSGLITSKYYIAPNFVISLLLDHSENPRDYIKTLPKGAEIVLSEFPVKRFDARTTSFKDVLSNIGESYHQTLPKLYNALISGEIEVKAEMDDFFDSVARDLEAPSETDIDSETDITVLRNKIKEQEGVIKMLQNIVEGKDFSSGSAEYIAKIENLKTQINNLERRLKEKDDRISELEIQLARIDILETRIKTLQSDILARDAEIADLRTRLKVSSGLPGGATAGDLMNESSEAIEIWKKKVMELQNELLERNTLINKLKTQLTGQLEDKEARAILAEISQKLSTQPSATDDLEEEMKSRYITL